MARTTKLSFSLGRTMPSNNYAPIRFDCFEEIELEPGDDVDAEQEALRRRVAQRFLAQCAALSPKP